MKTSRFNIKKMCSPAIYKRGLDYLNQGRVHIKNRDSDSFSAVVDGERLYNVSVKHSNSYEITDCFCTCPYFDTMGTVCKHIVAAVEEREKELSGVQTEDENDRISKQFISRFSTISEKKSFLSLSFEISFREKTKTSMFCDVALFVDGQMISDTEGFLNSFITGTTFRISKKTDFHPDIYTFGEQEEKILRILCESYENRTMSDVQHIPQRSYISLGAEAVKRLVSYLPLVDYKIIINRMDMGRVLVVEENPEVVIDISAIFGEVSMYVSNYGLSLVPDASVFFYEGAVFLTDENWRRIFLPVYRAMAEGSRSQIVFKDEDSLAFATYVLPQLEKFPGVITDGLEEYVIKQKPEFTVYLDSRNHEIICKVKVNYGQVSFFLPESENNSGYIVVRDVREEDKILELLQGFAYKNGFYRADDDDVIFDFIQNRLPVIKKDYNLLESDLFSNIKINKSVPLSADVFYNKEAHLLEAVLGTKLTEQEIADILLSVKLKKKFYRNKNGDFYDIDAVAENVILFERLFLENGKMFSKREMPEYNMLYLYAAAQNKDLFNINCSSELNEYVESVKNTHAEIPAHLENTLRGYQREGVDWLKQLSCFSFGGILADDMGLGKTLQMLTFLSMEKKENPVLIVTPSALTYNWLHEFDKYLPGASVMIIDGNQDERMRKISLIDNFEYIIVSYPLLRRDIEYYEEKTFSYCILDEAQAIKNPDTMNATSVKRINAKHRFALTGTPIENSLRELWSIFDFLIPGYLGEYRDFKALYEMPSNRDGYNSAIDELKTKIKPFIIRRMKKDVLKELPEKVEEVIYTKMTEEQEKMYVAYRELAYNKALAIMQEDGRANIEMLTLLLRLRQISCHPSLFDSAYKKGSGKLDVLFELINTAILSGHRILVFSQFTSMLSIISAGLRERGFDYFYIDGSTPAAKRPEMCTRFNEGEKNIFLISLKAGGTGLNLTGADMVIHYDPWWNPAVTDQASDRAYRIGQNRSVHVIRMACENTIEAKIIQLQEMKKNLAHDVINVNSTSFGALSNDEILLLFE